MTELFMIRWCMGDRVGGPPIGQGGLGGRGGGPILLLCRAEIISIIDAKRGDKTTSSVIFWKNIFVFVFSFFRFIDFLLAESCVCVNRCGSWLTEDQVAILDDALRRYRGEQPARSPDPEDSRLFSKKYRFSEIVEKSRKFRDFFFGWSKKYFSENFFPTFLFS